MFSADLDLWEVQNRLLIRDDIKVHSFPHGVAQEAAHVPLPGDDDQVHACAVCGQTVFWNMCDWRLTTSCCVATVPTCYQANGSHDATYRPGDCRRGNIFFTWESNTQVIKFNSVLHPSVCLCASSVNSDMNGNVWTVLRLTPVDTRVKKRMYTYLTQTVLPVQWYSHGN